MRGVVKTDLFFHIRWILEKMAQQQHFNCDGVTGERDPCTRRGVNELDGFHFCGTHLRIYNEARALHGPRPAARCHVISGRRNYCPYPCAPDHILCQRHLPLEEGGPRRQARLLAGWNADDLAELLANPDIFVVGMEDIDIPPELLVAPAVPLGPPPIAADPQNVHRKEVSEKTNKATKFLMGVKLPERGQENLWKIAAMKFLTFIRGHDMVMYVDVMADMEHWSAKETCREVGDYLYCILLYKLIVYIQSSEHANELWKRLWEECCESLHMCCEGHISRLCNVLVGFVEGLDPPVSLGEVLQQKMAAIASQDIPDADKKRMAIDFFDEHGIPDAERVAWLDAF